MLDRIRKALKRRPVRVVEALLAVVAAVGVAVTPEVEEAARALVAALAAVGIVGGETAQRKTNSRHYTRSVEDERDQLRRELQADGAPGEPA